MKRLLGVLLAATAFGALAGSAFAHEDDGDDNAAYSQYYGGYQNFDALYQHDWQGIQHGLRDGSYTPREARYFATQLRIIRQRDAYYRSSYGTLSPQEGRDIQVRLQRLHEVMHRAHEDGHGAQEDWNNQDPGYGGAYGSQGSGGYYPR